MEEGRVGLGGCAGDLSDHRQALGFLTLSDFMGEYQRIIRDVQKKLLTLWSESIGRP